MRPGGEIRPNEVRDAHLVRGEVGGGEALAPLTGAAAAEEGVHVLPGPPPRVRRIVGRPLPHPGQTRLHRELTDRLPGRWPGILSARIPSSADVERMASLRAPLTAFAPSSRAAIAFEALSSEVHAGIGAPAPV